jgi:hypothetical protein
MAHIRVTSARLGDGLIHSLDVELLGLGHRAIDRDTAVRWMRDGHSLVPAAGGSALQLVTLEDGDEPRWFIRADNAPEAQDSLPASLSA